jgi:hypothetical protein
VKEIGHCDTADAALDLALAQSVQGKEYAYIADHGGGMRVIDVSDPFHPTEISSITVNGYVDGVAVSKSVSDGRTYAYITGGGLYIIDITDPILPKEISRIFFPSAGFSDVAVHRDYVYVAQVPYLDSDRQEHNGGLRIIDASNPSQPINVGFLEVPGYTWQMVVLGNYAYLAEGDSGLRVIDVTNPRNPIEAGYYTLGTATALAVTEHYIFVANNVFDNNNPSSGVLILRFYPFQVYLPLLGAKDKA